ncbi:MAG: 2-oxoacid:acceptor oxidoreductase family protein [Ruminococcus sp.]|jgi:2-oxoglutarate ferredoxin oxidoreductase subunit gamma|nr:2-oxoacid:acceptor oxidoreductase family protein [Ruminococcus sp.]
MTDNILIAGFGGQGILFAGKILVYAGMASGKEVSWLPSYGPEMRGGTCNCSVVISDEPIGSPLVITPDVLIALNTPSLEKFINNVKPGGVVLIDTTMCDAKVTREDVKVFALPATEMADTNDLKGGANIILLGKLLGETKILTEEAFAKAVEKVVPISKPKLRENDMRALTLGMQY